MWKRGEIAPKEQFLLFSTLLYIQVCIFLTSGIKLHIHLLNVIVQFIVFLTLNSDMSRYGYLEVFQWIPWIRDNESRLYVRNAGSWIDVTRCTAGCQPLNFLNLLYFVLMVGIPNSRSIFKLWPDQGVIHVGRLPHTRHLSFNVPLNKSDGFVGRIDNPVHVRAMWDPVTCTTAFREVKLHVPVSLPHRQFVHIP